MSDKDNLRTALSRLSIDSVTVDPLGRVVLTDPALAALVERFQAANLRAEGNNYGCCTNGALCKANKMDELQGVIQSVNR